MLILSITSQTNIEQWFRDSEVQNSEVQWILFKNKF